MYFKFLNLISSTTVAASKMFLANLYNLDIKINWNQKYNKSFERFFFIFFLNCEDFYLENIKDTVIGQYYQTRKAILSLLCRAWSAYCWVVNLINYEITDVPEECKVLAKELVKLLSNALNFRTKMISQSFFKC